MQVVPQTGWYNQPLHNRSIIHYPLPMNTEEKTTTTLSTSEDERLRFLQQIPIFQEIENQNFIPQLATHLEEETFPANHTIFNKGEAGNLLYILLDGRVQVHIDNFPLIQLQTGAYFGEMALFDSNVRSASVTTLSESKCLILTRQQIHQAVKENPAIAINMIRVLVSRVRKLNRLFSASEDLFYLILKEKMV